MYVCQTFLKKIQDGRFYNTSPLEFRVFVQVSRSEMRYFKISKIAIFRLCFFFEVAEIVAKLDQLFKLVDLGKNIFFAFSLNDLACFISVDVATGIP